MRASHRLGICLVIACAIGASARISATPQTQPGQSQPGVARPGAIQVPARDAPPPTGTSAISGRVVSNDGKPVRKALVRISGQNLPQGRMVRTDAAGQYEALTLPAGSFAVSASKSGYVPAAYGASDTMRAPKMVTVGTAARVDEIDLVLSHGCVITGHVFDEFAEPVLDVNVMVLREQSVAGRRRPMSAGGGRSTDDLGRPRHGRNYMSRPEPATPTAPATRRRTTPEPRCSPTRSGSRARAGRSRRTSTSDSSPFTLPGSPASS
jgi:hypothetical protein